MASDIIYPQEFDYICLHCPLPAYQCPERRNTAKNRAVCPLRRIVKANLPEATVKEFRELTRLRYGEKYRMRHFVRMLAIQAERNQVEIGGLYV